MQDPRHKHEYQVSWWYEQKCVHHPDDESDKHLSARDRKDLCLIQQNLIRYQKEPRRVARYLQKAAERLFAKPNPF